MRSYNLVEIIKDASQSLSTNPIIIPASSQIRGKTVLNLSQIRGKFNIMSKAYYILYPPFFHSLSTNLQSKDERRMNEG